MKYQNQTIYPSGFVIKGKFELPQRIKQLVKDSVSADIKIAEQACQAIASIIENNRKKRNDVFMNKFNSGDWVILKNLTGGLEYANGQKALVDSVKTVPAFYYSYFEYSVIVESNSIVIDGVLEGNMDLYVKVEDDVWPPVCTCPKDVWMYQGCQCGAMKREKAGRKEENRGAGENI